MTIKCLVTGGAGFIGSNLVDNLLSDQDYHVAVIDDFSTGSLDNLLNHQKLREKLVIHDIDVIDVGQLNEHYDIIYHLAALPRIHICDSNPVKAMHINVVGTTAMLDYAIKIQCDKFIFVSSSTCDYSAYSNMYSLSKHLGEKITQCYAINNPKLKAAIARPYNVYGPRHKRKGKFATLIGLYEQSLIDDTPLQITGTGLQRRDFTHVNDVCRGLVHIAKYCTNEVKVYGLGAGHNYSITEVAEMFRPNGIHQYIKKRAGEADQTLARNIPDGWSASINLKDYISEFKDCLQYR